MGKDYYLDLYIDNKNIGFDVTAEMVGHQNLVVFDNDTDTKAHTLSVNLRDEFIGAAIESMGDERFFIFHIYINLFKNHAVNRIICNGRKHGNILQLERKSFFYYEKDDIYNNSPLY